MRRADRLFHIIQLIRGRRLTTAAYLAERLEVSERTIYRDVADLQLQGVPIEGEAGVGYRLGAGFDLPPMMFTQDEAKALVASVRMAQVWLDPALAQGAEDALGKILSVLPVRRAGGRRSAGRLRAARRPAAGGAAHLADAARGGARAAARSSSTTATWPTRPASAPCGRWAASTGARSGRWRPGASSATISAASASIA